MTNIELPRKWAILAVLPLVAIAIAAFGGTRANAQNAASPTMKSMVVVSISGYDELKADVGFLGEIVGKPDLAESVDKILDMFTQGQGLAGLDKSKPWGVAVQTDGLQFQSLAFVPVTDLKKLLGVLETLKVETQARDGGIFELQTATPLGTQSLFIKQNGGWAFVGQSADALSQLPANPLTILGELPKKYDLAVRLHVQNIPELFRQMAVAQMQAGLQQGLQELPDQQDDDAQLRQKLAEAQLKSLTRLIEETDQVTIGWLIDSKQRRTHIDFNLVAVAGSQLAKQAAALRDAKSAFAGFLSPASAASLNFSSTYPPDEIQQMLAMLRTMRERALRAIDEEADIPGDTARKAIKSALGEVMDVLKATVTSGTMDGGAVLQLSPGEKGVTLAAGAHLVGAERIESALKQIVELAKDEPDFPGVQWGVAKHQGVRFHTTRVPVPDENARKVLGDTLDVVVGIGQDSLYVALGKDGLATLKTVIDQSKKAADRSVAPAAFVLSLGPIMKFAAAQTDDPTTAALAGAFDSVAGADHVKITLTAIPQGFSYRFEVEPGVLKALGQIAPAVAAQAAGAR